MNAKIITCTCEHKTQDELHGKQKRVANPTTKKSGDKTTYRCTVCNKESV